MPSILPIPDIADDLLLVDDVEYVTYQARALDGTVQATYFDVVGLGLIVTGALTGMGGGGQFSKDSRTWYILSRTLPVASPKKGDRIFSDAKGCWEVFNDNAEVFEGQHTCICTRIPDAPSPIPAGALLDETGSILFDESAAARLRREQQKNDLPQSRKAAKEEQRI